VEADAARERADAGAGRERVEAARERAVVDFLACGISNLF
jgi:hypothetical protein